MEAFNRYFLDTIKYRYAKFDGRASRSEFWYFTLFYALISIALALVDIFVLNPMLGTTPERTAQGGLLEIIFALAMLVPSVAIAVRRLHDMACST